jgi:D-psicose/D-tagatose/L-ribulose 3-epimerase
MTRFGVNSFLLSSGFTNDDLPMIRLFKDWGADVIELAIHQPGSIRIDPLRQALDAAGIEQVPVCGMFPPDRDLRGTDAQQQACRDYLSDLVCLAAELGSKIVGGPFYSSVGRCELHTDAEKQQQTDLIARNLDDLCRQADRAGIVLAMEPLNRFETDCVNTLDQARSLVEKVGSPALKILIDTFHMHIEENNSADAIREVGPLIGHVHASANHRGVPGHDQVDWTAVFAALRDVEYRGDVIIETFAPDNDTIARAASIWMQRFDSPRQLTVEGLGFLRRIAQQVQLHEVQA